MERDSYFIEGLQGAGKSTLQRKLSDRLPEYTVFREGDYSPVELAWCAYTTEEQYQNVLARYPMLAEEIKGKTVLEGEHKIICYTQILTDVSDFHRNLEKLEIYNGNLDRESFEAVVLERFGKWDGERQIFECSIFQNIIENQILYLGMEDEEILAFYRRVERTLAGRPYKILYLDVEDIAGAIDVIRRGRSDDAGNELWFLLMLRYLEESPYGQEHGLSGLKGLLTHLAHRRDLERRIIEEIFREQTVVIRAKDYQVEEIIKC